MPKTDMGTILENISTKHIDFHTKEIVHTRFLKKDCDEEVNLEELAFEIISYLYNSIMPPEENEEESMIRSKVQPIITSLLLPFIKELYKSELINEEITQKLTMDLEYRQMAIYFMLLGFISNAMIKKQAIDIIIEREELSDLEIDRLLNNERVTKMANIFLANGIDPNEGFKQVAQELGLDKELSKPTKFIKSDDKDKK